MYVKPQKCVINASMTITEQPSKLTFFIINQIASIGI